MERVIEESREPTITERTKVALRKQNEKMNAKQEDDMLEEASKIENLTKKELSPVTKEDYAVCGIEK